MPPSLPTITRRVSARGQVTLGKQVLRHLGVKPGDALEVELLPGRRLRLSAAWSKGSIEDFIGCLAGRTERVVTLDEMNQVIAEGWAGVR